MKLISVIRVPAFHASTMVRPVLTNRCSRTYLAHRISFYQVTESKHYYLLFLPDLVQYFIYQLFHQITFIGRTTVQAFPLHIIFS